MGTNLKFTLRALRQAPWHTATIVGVTSVTLALATNIFAVVDGAPDRCGCRRTDGGYVAREARCSASQCALIVPGLVRYRALKYATGTQRRTEAMTRNSIGASLLDVRALGFHHLRQQRTRLSRCEHPHPALGG